jgi:hypothetical protein
MFNWQTPVPSFGQTNSMKVEIDHSLIFNVGATEVRSGAYHVWEKLVSNSGGTITSTYSLTMYGYEQIGSGGRVIQLQVGPFVTINGAGYRIGFAVRHFFNGSSISPQCKYVAERKEGLDSTFIPSGLDFWFDLRSPGLIQHQNQKFDCFLGWDTAVTWTTTRSASGGGFGVGMFDFAGLYIDWVLASWTKQP